MNVNEFSTSSAQDAVADDRIYNDSKGRPVGLAGKVNRVTNTVDIPERFPLQTPEDKRHLDTLFNRCFSYAEKYLKSNSIQHVAVDDRIYNGSKERPVELEGKINRVTNTVDVPERFPLQTPER